MKKIRGLYYYASTLGQFRLLFHFKLNKKVCRNTRCAFFFFIDLKIDSFF